MKKAHRHCAGIKTCQYAPCGKPFRPWYRQQRFCSRSCGALAGRVQSSWREVRIANLAKANARRFELARDRYRKQVEEVFGALTDREVTLIRLAMKRGYHKGYNAARVAEGA
jgi:hypothetical protein